MSVWVRKIVLAQHIYAHLQWLVQGTAMLCTCRKECNKYDMTPAQCFWSAHHNDSSFPSPWFAISSLPTYLLSQFQDGVKKVNISKLGCEKYFCKVTYSPPLEMLLEWISDFSSKEWVMLGPGATSSKTRYLVDNPMEHFCPWMNTSACKLWYFVVFETK